tara:strand:- start:1706 stop:3547 length:1842 start_codon:yes stop_codon:yes gene_type:complete
MCGLAGILGTRPDAEAVDAALSALAHRGPDGNGVFRSDDATLLHTRLNIIDLTEAGSQPMQDAETGVVIVYNGEVYNMLELRDQLDPAHFRGRSDTEVVLRLYLEAGVEALDRLRGMFAFAIWDPRDRSLNLVRDRFGIKPLYLFKNAGTCIFGSEVKAMLELGAPCRLDKRTARRYLEFGVLATGRETFFQDINAVPPGRCLTVHDDRIQERIFWSPATLTDAISTDDADDAEIEELIWSKLEEVVRQHLLSDVPVGISLSSGLDSRALAELLCGVSSERFHTFTFGFDEPEYDEISRTDNVDFRLGIERHNLRTRPDEMLDDLREAISIFEAPLGGLGTLSAYRMMRLAREAKVPVLLSGEGADEIFGGYSYYQDVYFRELYESGRHDLLDQELAADGRRNGVPMTSGSDEFSRKVLKAGGEMRAPDGTSLADGVFLGTALRDVEAAEPTAPSRTLREAMIRDLTEMKIPKLLMFQDRASMAFSTEVRVPFLDHELAELVYRLPAKWLIRNGVSKYLPKRLLRKKTGVDLLEEGKLFVATPQREWLKGPLFEKVNDVLDDGCLADLRLIDYPAFRQAYADYAAEPALGNSFFAWKLVNLEMLAQRYFSNTH